MYTVSYLIYLNEQNTFKFQGLIYLYIKYLIYQLRKNKIIYYLFFLLFIIFINYYF